MSCEFLEPSAGPAVVAHSPMARQALAAGARFEVRDGWNVAISYGGDEAESEAVRTTVGWADVSHLRKLELQVAAPPIPGPPLELGNATRAAGAWWCPVTTQRALVIGEGEAPAVPGDERASVVDVTTQYAALCVCGPLARETIARFCALDLRGASCPVGGFRPGSVARTPGCALREGPERFLLLFGWALGEYMWTVVSDAARHLGGAPVGVDAPPAVAMPRPDAAAHA